MTYLRLVITEEVYLSPLTRKVLERLEVDNKYYTLVCEFAENQIPKANIHRGQVGCVLFHLEGHRLEKFLPVNSDDGDLLAKLRARSWVITKMTKGHGYESIEKYLTN